VAPGRDSRAPKLGILGAAAAVPDSSVTI
jgi:hypothetical protein